MVYVVRRSAQMVTMVTTVLRGASVREGRHVTGPVERVTALQDGQEHSVIVLVQICSGGMVVIATVAVPSQHCLVTAILESVFAHLASWEVDVNMSAVTGGTDWGVSGLACVTTKLCVQRLMAHAAAQYPA